MRCSTHSDQSEEDGGLCYSALVKRDLDVLGRRFGAILVRTDFEVYQRDHERDPKRFPDFEDRIYPGYYAPVIFEREKGERAVAPMRYGAYPPPTVRNPNAYTTYNARRDNLSSPFWSEAFGRKHGFVVLESFYEWVEVRDLLRAGVVSLKEVEEEFARQKEQRRLKILASGKRYKPTAAEQKDSRDRKIVIEFKPEDGQELIVPTIFSHAKVGEGEFERQDAGFAIVTDDPPAEVRAAGHDRCPIVLESSALDEWLRPSEATAQALIDLLSQRRRTSFRHSLAKAA